jgi:hypothetical protein
MPSRVKAAPKRKAAKPAPKTAAAPKKSAAKLAPAKKSATRPDSARPAPRPVALSAAVAAVEARPAPVVVRPPARPVSAGQVLTAQQAEERRKAATRKLFARIRSLEAILGADLRKRGSLLLSQAVDKWYAEATSATATDTTITNAARAVIAQL